MRLLVVEDQRGIAVALRQGPGEQGYAVDVARDGATGREYDLAASYDGILLDILLPEPSRKSVSGHHPTLNEFNALRHKARWRRAENY